MAEGVGDTSRLVCAATDVVACTSSPGCMEGQAKSFDLPELMVIDLEQKPVRASDQGGHEEITEIKNAENSGNHLIL